MKNDAQAYLGTVKSEVSHTAEKHEWQKNAKVHLVSGLNPLRNLVQELGAKVPQAFRGAVNESGSILQAGTEPEKKSLLEKGVTFLKDATRHIKLPHFNPGGLTPG